MVYFLIENRKNLATECFLGSSISLFSFFSFGKRKEKHRNGIRLKFLLMWHEAHQERACFDYPRTYMQT